MSAIVQNKSNIFLPNTRRVRSQWKAQNTVIVWNRTNRFWRFFFFSSPFRFEFRRPTRRCSAADDAARVSEKTITSRSRGTKHTARKSAVSPVSHGYVVGTRPVSRNDVRQVGSLLNRFVQKVHGAEDTRVVGVSETPSEPIIARPPTRWRS